MSVLNHPDAPPTLEEVWRLFKETNLQFKETDRKFQETDRKFQETDRKFQETDRKFQETARQLQETKQIVQEITQQSKATELAIQTMTQNIETSELAIQTMTRNIETSELAIQTMTRNIEASTRKQNQLEHLFTSQWGKLMESLVEGSLIKIFNERGMPVQHTYTRAKGKHEGRQWEIDIVAKNGDAVIMVEVKTTLRPDDVKHFLQKLPQVKQWMREYANNTVYGAMAYLNADAGAEAMAQHKGLFVIKATGDSAYLENLPDFVARTY